jgi:hypothetical protein
MKTLFLYNFNIKILLSYLYYTLLCVSFIVVAADPVFSPNILRSLDCYVDKSGNNFCLPDYDIAGFFKCGSSMLYFMISKMEGIELLRKEQCFDNAIFRKALRTHNVNIFEKFKKLPLLSACLDKGNRPRQLRAHAEAARVHATVLPSFRENRKN